MKRICYVSQSAVGLTELQFEAMVNSSFSNNGRDGISGLLLYDDRRFLQAIEGGDRKIDECFARIRLDNRHHDIAVFEDNAIVTREFGSWSLRVRSPFELNPRDFKASVANDIQHVKSAKLKAMFIGFASMARC